MASKPLRWVYVVTNKITISLSILTNIIRIVDFRLLSSLCWCLHVERYHHVAKFLRKRLLFACEVWTTILALKKVAPKSTIQIKIIQSEALFLLSIFLLFIIFDHKMAKGVDITQMFYVKLSIGNICCILFLGYVDDHQFKMASTPKCKDTKNIDG